MLRPALISRAQLSDCGVSEGAIRRLVGRRDLLRLLPGVYTPRPVPTSFIQRAWAAVLWSGGTLSHYSAAQLWQLPVTTTKVTHLIVSPDYRPTASGLVLHRVGLRPQSATIVDGLPVTTRSMTTLDLLRGEPLRSAHSLLDRAVQYGWVDVRDLERAVRDQPGRTGNDQLRRLVARIEPGADAESERVLHRLLRRAAVTGWVAQYRVRLTSGFAYLDVAFPAHRLAIEVDGRRYHDERSDAFEGDRTRQNELQLLGWRVLRFTWAALRDRPDAVIDTINASLR